MVLVERCLVDDGSDVPDWIEVIDEWNGAGEAPLFGSIRSLARLAREGRGRGGFFNLRVSDWIWPASEWSVSGRGGYFRQSFQLDASDIGRFCKSDSGFKALGGRVIADADALELVRNVTAPYETLFLAPARKVSKEARFWVADDRVVSRSPYGADWHDEETLDAYQSEVERWNLRYSPDDRYVVDVCTCEGRIMALEYNCYPCAGFYRGDIGRIVRAYLDCQ